MFELQDGAILRHHSRRRTLEWVSDFEQLEYEDVEYVTMNNNRSNGFVYIGSLNK
ncbi:hypothetical protein [Priestia aryabhattai]